MSVNRPFKFEPRLLVFWNAIALWFVAFQNLHSSRIIIRACSSVRLYIYIDRISQEMLAAPLYMYLQLIQRYKTVFSELELKITTSRRFRSAERIVPRVYFERDEYIIKYKYCNFRTCWDFVLSPTHLQRRSPGHVQLVFWFPIWLLVIQSQTLRAAIQCFIAICLR